jgi:hypothetical protein
MTIARCLSVTDVYFLGYYGQQAGQQGAETQGA